MPSLMLAIKSAVRMLLTSIGNNYSFELHLFLITWSLTVRHIIKAYNKHKNHPYLITSSYVMDISFLRYNFVAANFFM